MHINNFILLGTWAFTMFKNKTLCYKVISVYIENIKIIDKRVLNQSSRQDLHCQLLLFVAPEHLWSQTYGLGPICYHKECSCSFGTS